MAISTEKLKNYAKGVAAHVAIQTMYRIQHPNNFIVTERSVWIGDSRISRISEYAEKVDKYFSWFRKLEKIAVPNKSVEFYSFLLYLLHESTAEINLTGKIKLIHKRYDIVDFGSV